MKFKEALSHLNIPSSMATIENIETAYRGQSAVLKRKLEDVNNPDEKARLLTDLTELVTAKSVLIQRIQSRAESDTTPPKSRVKILAFTGVCIAAVIIFVAISGGDEVTPLQDITDQSNDITHLSSDALSTNADELDHRVDIKAIDFDLEPKLDSPQARQQRTDVRNQIRQVKKLVGQWNTEFANQGFALPNELNQLIWQARSSYDTSLYADAQQQYSTVIKQLTALMESKTALASAYQSALASSLAWSTQATQTGHHYADDDHYQQTLYVIKQRLNTSQASDIETMATIRSAYDSAITQSQEIKQYQSSYELSLIHI